MTLLRDRDDIQLECETCPTTTAVYDKDEFNHMVNEAKAANWLIKQDARGEWTHTCPVCKSGDRLARARQLFG